MALFARRRFARRRLAIREIVPEDVLLDASNLPGHNRGAFEGRVVRPVGARPILTVGFFFLLVLAGFASRAFVLQVRSGAAYAAVSRDNALARSVTFATRGIIYDRTGRELAWNESLPASPAASSSPARATFARRSYADLPGLAHVLGFVQYPRADAKGAWWRESYQGLAGIEREFDALLQGRNGARMIETDAHGRVLRENIVVPPVSGEAVTLSIDADVQSHLHSFLAAHAAKNRFRGGAAVIMDVETGELLAITSFPEYDNGAFAEGAAAIVSQQSNDARTPLLDRAVSGLYAPGSIVKPIFAAAALNEGLISPDKQILSTGALILPNPYDPSHPSIFRDWTVHGWVDMRTAIAVSSDEYFYAIGGGVPGQKGLGIERLERYARAFGLGTTTGIALSGEKAGVIPTPAWKKQVFGEDDPWRIGNTYHTAIGQYGFQITPLQAAAFTAAIANGGRLLVPQLVASSTPASASVGIPDEYLHIVREGMRLAVTSPRRDATVKALNIAHVEIAGKTGTAQIGAHNEWMNSWSIGFWPASRPRFAYAVVLEKAPAGTASGASPGLYPFFAWLAAHHPEYVQ